MTLRDAIDTTCLHEATVVAGMADVGRELSWVHVVDLPDPLPWVAAGQFVLTTGHAWLPDADWQRQLIRGFHKQGVVGIGIAVPNYLECFPAAMLHEASRLGMPLLEIPWRIPFSQIAQEVHNQLLKEQLQWREQAEQTFRQLSVTALDHSNLNELLWQISLAMRQRLILTDSYGNLLAAADGEGADKTWMPDKDALPEEAFIHAGPQNAVEETGAKQFWTSVKTHEGILGFLGMTFDRRTPEAFDIVAAEHAALVVALFITHRRKLDTNDGMLGSEILASILEDRVVDTPIWQERLQVVGISNSAGYRLAALQFPEDKLSTREGIIYREATVERLRRYLKGLKGPAVHMNQQSLVYCLIPKQADLEEIEELLTDETYLALGFSSLHTGIAGIQTAYRELQSIAPFLSPARVVFYESMLLPRVFNGDRAAQDALIARTIGSLIDNHPRWLETADALVRNEFNLSETARHLNLNLSSMRYRLSRLSQMTGLDWNAPDVRYRIRTALWLHSWLAIETDFWGFGSK